MNSTANSSAQPLDIVGLGLATLDVIVRANELPTWQHGTRLSGFALDGGGMAATAMAAAARLGARVGFIGTAGNDYAAQIKVDSLAKYGVDVSRLVRRDCPESQVVLVCVEEATGERVFSGLRSIVDTQLRVDELDRHYITSADFLHLDGFNYNAALQAAQWMRDAGKMVIYDGGTTSGKVSDAAKKLLKYVDVLICGEGFAPGLTGESDIVDAGRAALETGPQVVVQTLGARGSHTTTANEEFHTPGFEVDVLDTTGAGDVFHGAYIAGLMHSWSLKATARFASAVAAIKCTRLGGRAGIPSFDEVSDFLNE